ncbi:chloride channel protein [Geothrix sp. PMB-07]|uniref:chloride channel protein n=1 Tax=Geothrix sp. PMB-07 TaxID=3068640 RepID=UPI0027426BC3|nr:chloride channel protein [Geothrix sp. PMB-07]WLT32089.1 chloride channel protein [Geothrix sp. PMB-07]
MTDKPALEPLGGGRPLALPSRLRALRMVAQARRLALAVLPMGAVIGVVAALALSGLQRLEHLLSGQHWRGLALVGMPFLGLLLAGLWLRVTRVGEVSLVRDLVQARTHPLTTFQLGPSLAKVMACGLTIGFGGSAGTEGPAKWLGAAVGAQFHRWMRSLARRFPQLRRFLAQPGVVVTAGSAAALAAIFRAPLSGALLAVEHEGELNAVQAAPALVASATGYLAFVALRGNAPLLGTPATYHLQVREIFWALPLGLTCAVAASLFRRLLRFGRHHLRRFSLPARGALAGLGLVLLALPGAWLWPGLPITQGSGLDLVAHLIRGDTLPSAALAFLALKLAATALTFAGGGVGGTWLPSVAMGAAVGAVFDVWAGLGQPGLFALVGASAFAGAVHRTLLVPVVFLAETTGQAALVVPALVATVAAFEGTRAD